MNQDYFKKTKKTRIKNLCYVNDDFKPKPEETQQKKSFAEHEIKYNEALKVIPLFFGVNGVDYRGDNCFQPLSRDLFMPPRPTQSE